MQFLKDLFQYKKRSIYFKMFIKISIPIILIITAICCVVSVFLKSLSTQKITLNAEKYSETYISLIENSLSDCRNISTLLASNDDIRYFVANNDSISKNHDDLFATYEKIDIFEMTYKFIDSIYIYSDNKRIVVSDNTLTSIDAMRDMHWYLYDGKKDTPYSCIRLKNDIFPSIISFVTPVDVNSNKGAVIVNCNLTSLNDSFAADLRTYLLSGKEIIYGSNLEDIYVPFAKEPLIEKYNPGNGIKLNKVYVHGQDAVFIKKSETYDWYYEIVSALENGENGGPIGIIMVVCVLFCVILGLVIIYMILKSVSDPILTLEDFIKNHGRWKKENDDFPAEIQRITDEIFTVIQYNNEIKTEMEKKMSILKEAQISALNSQMNPHFLYNVLNNIYLQTVDDFSCLHKSSEMLLKLSRVMRYSMNINIPLVFVEEDIRCAKMYVDIMKVRYPNIDVEFNTEDIPAKCIMVRMSLQAMIENAYKHAFPDRVSGKISINGYVNDKELIFEISDNGCGMSPAQLILLNETLQEPISRNEKTGISNLNSRIKLIFGNEYGISVKLNKTVGTTFILKFPKKKEEEHENEEG